MVIALLEIAIITVMINYMLKFFWGSRAMDAVIGFFAFLLIFLFASWLHFPVLHKLMYNIVNVAVIAIVVIFQPEIRLALSKLRVKGKKYRTIPEFDDFLERLTQSVYRLAERQIGALIVIENQDSYQEYAASYVQMNATFSSELLESIFMTSTPLHDGALVLRETSIVAAGVILPLAHDTAQLSKSMGTRHRAALGASQKTDAVIIVISEESGKVSIARDGILTRGVRTDRFKGIMSSLFTPSELKEKLKWGDKFGSS